MKSREEFIKNLGDDASMDDELSAIAESGGTDVEDMRSRVDAVKSKKKVKLFLYVRISPEFVHQISMRS